MTIGASLFLFLLPLAAAPVLFHLLVRRNRKTILFSTQMFFDSMQPHLSFHRKFREPLLLAARALLLLFLLLALARLAFPGIGSLLGLAGKQVVVVVIDNSSSMVGPVEDGDRSKLIVAVEGARALLKNMDPGGYGAVVLMVEDPAARFGGITTDKETLLDFLESIRATDATGNPAKVLQQAKALLKNASTGGGGALHIFSDMQESEWNVPVADPEDQPENITVFVHRVPSAPYDVPNICPVLAELSSRRILPNQPYALEVLLRNDGSQKLDVRVNHKDSERSIATFQNVEMAGDAQRLVKVPVQPKTSGRHWVKVWLEGDAFEGDNQIFVPYICEEVGEIFFLGDEADRTFGLLPKAFSPAGDGSLTSLIPRYLSPSNLQGRMQQSKPMLVVLTWASAAALDAATSALLDQYTQQGGNLLVLPAIDARQVAGKVPAWLAAGQKPLVSLPLSVPLRVSGSKSPFWSDLRNLDGRVRIGTAFTKRYFPLSFEQDSGYVALLSAGDGDDLFALRKHGEGQIVLSGLAFGRNSDWSTLPRLPTFLVMTQPIALGAVTTLINASASIVAGQAPRLMPGGGDEMSIVTLLGDQVEWVGPRGQAPLLVRGGAYIAAVGERETSLTVMPSDKEGSDAFIENDKIPALDGMQSQVSTLSDEDDFRRELQSSLAGAGLCLPFLLLAFLFMLAEGLLSAPPSKWKDSGNKDSDSKIGGATPADAGVETS